MTGRRDRIRQRAQQTEPAHEQDPVVGDLSASIIDYHSANGRRVGLQFDPDLHPGAVCATCAPGGIRQVAYL